MTVSQWGDLEDVPGAGSSRGAGWLGATGEGENHVAISP